MNSSRSLPWVALPAAFGGAGLLVCIPLLQPTPASGPLDAATLLVSRAEGGPLGVDASFFPAISADGQVVAFASDAWNLVSDDTNAAEDIFVKNLTTGALVCVSRNAAGGPAQGNSSSVSMSGDGTRVVFASEAPDLVAGDTNALADVFLRDLAAGTTTRLSLGANQADGSSAAPRISQDGSVVAFASTATNLVAGDDNGLGDVFVRILSTGTFERISVSAAGAAADGVSEGAAVSSDGRYVAFASQARNLIPGEDPNAGSPCWNVYRRDRQAGTTIRVSVNVSGQPGGGASFAPVLSGDGRYVAFVSRASDLVQSDLDDKADVFVRDLVAGTTTRASIGQGGLEPTADSGRPSISANGRFVVFESSASNLVAGFVPEESTWCYLRDLQNDTTSVIVIPSPEPGPAGGAVSPTISADGHWVAFSSAESALVGGDGNGQEDVFARGPLP